MEAILRKQLGIKELQLKQFRRMRGNSPMKNSDTEFARIENNMIGEIQCLRGLLNSTIREHGRRRK